MRRAQRQHARQALRVPSAFRAHTRTRGFRHCPIGALRTRAASRPLQAGVHSPRRHCRAHGRRLQRRRRRSLASLRPSIAHPLGRAHHCYRNHR